MTRRALLAFPLACAAIVLGGIGDNRACAAQALQTLYRSNPVAAENARIAKAELVFPKLSGRA